MHTDYKQKRVSNKKRSAGNGTTWMLSGIILGLTVGVVLYKVSSHITEQQAPRHAEVAEPSATEDETQAHADSSKPERPEFAYHALLPKLEVPVDEDYSAYVKDVKGDSTENQLDEQQLQLALADTPDGSDAYSFQIASYRDMDAAKQAGNRLTEKGIATFIQPATVNGLQWYRVVTVAIAVEDVNVVESAIQTFGYNNPIKRRIQ